MHDDYPRPNGTVYRLIRGAFRVLFRVFTRSSVSGTDRLPAAGPFILASNHRSFVDGPLILARTPFVIHGLVGVEYRDHVFGPLCTALGCVYVHRGKVDRAALRQCRHILEDGGVLAVAIEGTRTRTGALNDGRNGVAWLASQLAVPVVPVAILGTDTVAPRLKRLRRPRVHAAFGAPLQLPSAPLSPDDVRACTTTIMNAVADLLAEAAR